MNNEPAFPTVDANREEDYGTRGMSLRDYFAAKAMQALISNAGHDYSLRGEIPSHAYVFADAMLDARAKL